MIDESIKYNCKLCREILQCNIEESFIQFYCSCENYYIFVANKLNISNIESFWFSTIVIRRYFNLEENQHLYIVEQRIESKLVSKKLFEFTINNALEFRDENYWKELVLLS